jgi:rhomboid protease GluP
MWVLWDMGRLVERLTGNVGMALAYLISGIMASLTSTWWRPELVSAGASGAVFGVLGVLLGFLVRGRSSIPAESLKGLRSSAIGFLLFNLFFGLTVPGIDMAAHVGGLATGILAGLVLGCPLSSGSTKGRTARNAILAAMGIFLIPLAARFMPEAPPDVREELSHFARTEEVVVKAYSDAIGKAQRGEMSDSELAAFVEREVLAPWQQARERLAAIHPSSKEASQLFAELGAYMELRAEAWEVLIEGARSGDASKVKDFQRKWQSANAMSKTLQSRGKSQDR